MELHTSAVHTTAAELGADLCGIASIDRFGSAPVGFHPLDVLPGCRSVIVLGKRFLRGTFAAASTIPYTIVRNELSAVMDRMTLLLCERLEDAGAQAVPTGAIGPCNRDQRTNKTRGIVSLKHAAEAAGLGRIGKNTLLVNDRFGNMIWLGAVLTTAELSADPPAAYTACPPHCTLCLDSCPVQALDGVSMDQRKCWEYAFGSENGGEWRIKCFTCRRVCPQCFGLKNHRAVFTPPV